MRFARRGRQHRQEHDTEARSFQRSAAASAECREPVTASTPHKYPLFFSWYDAEPLQIREVFNPPDAPGASNGRPRPSIGHPRGVWGLKTWLGKPDVPKIPEKNKIQKGSWSRLGARLTP